MTTISPAVLQQRSIVQGKSELQNPHNLIEVKDSGELGKIAEKEIGNMPYRIAVSGYSAPPEGYEHSTKDFLNRLKFELGQGSVAFVTSPTADKGSIDAITTEVSGLNRGQILYTTAQKYTKYINPDNFPMTINKQDYEKMPKYILPNGEEYSKSMAEASNICILAGGRNVAIDDFTNSVKKGNKAVIIDNPAINEPAWDNKKDRVGNASRYVAEQLSAFYKGKPLPHPEIGDFTADFLTENANKIAKNVKITKPGDEPISRTVRDVADFLR